MPRSAGMRSAVRPSATSRRLWLVGAVTLAVALAFALRGTAEPVSGRDLTTGPLYRVEPGTVIRAVHAAGTLAAPVASLSPRAAGHVAEVLVEPGDTVQAGQPLLRLETAALDAAVARAEADLRAAEARLELAAAPARPEETAAADSRVRAAQARLADLLEAAAVDTVAPARARLLAAQAALGAMEAGSSPAAVRAADEQARTAQAQLVGLRDQYNPIEVSAAQAQMEDAAAQLAAADASLAWLRAQPTGADLATLTAAVDGARARLTAAQAQLERAQAGPDVHELAEAQARVDSAHLALHEEQQKLDRARRGATETEIHAAEREVRDARARLQAAQTRQRNLLRPPSATEVLAAQATFNAAILRTQLRNSAVQGVISQVNPATANALVANDITNSLSSDFGDTDTLASDLLSSLPAGPPDPIQLTRSQEDLETARARLFQAQRRVEQLRDGPRPNDLATVQRDLALAESAFGAAESRLEAQRARPRPNEIAAAQAAVDLAAANARAAEARVDQLQANPIPAALAERVRDVEVARADLEAAEARQAQARAGAPQAALDAAERNRAAKAAALDAARVKLEALLAGPPAAAVVELEGAVARAEDTLQARQQPYTPEQLAAQRQAVAEAEAELRQQLASDRRGAVERQREQLLQAEQHLALLRSRSTPADLIDLQQAVERARADVATARAALESARLVAPFDGVVAQVNVSPGERVGVVVDPSQGGASSGAAPGGHAAVILVDSAQPRVDLALPEADVRELAAGQLAVVTVDSLPGQELTGVVSRIGPLGTLSQGVMTYPVQVKLDGALPLRLGAAVRLAVPIAEREDVLVVPERALRRAGDEVSVRVAGQTGEALRAVTVGASNGEVAEITSGLEAGDLIVLDDAPAGGPRS